MILAVTGGTGFVGQHLIRIAGERGLTVRALARREQPPQPHVTWIEGALDTPDRLAALIAGADAVIHIAGVIKATGRADFAAGNAAGTAAIVEAAQATGVRRFVQVSSLAAREPGLSDYGWSKREGEALVMASALDWTIVRPPAIYGRGDREMLELFRMAAKGVVLLPPGGRVSLIEADDLVRLLLALVPAREAIGHIYEPDDGKPGGWDHRGLARAIGDAVGRRILPLSLPAPLLRAGAAADALLRGRSAKLTPDRVRYFCHPDWVVAADAAPPPALWQATTPTRDGLRETAAWYRAEGWL